MGRAIRARRNAKMSFNKFMAYAVNAAIIGTVAIVAINMLTSGYVG